jgi:hypothetical protein
MRLRPTVVWPASERLHAVNEEDGLAEGRNGKASRKKWW